MLCQDKKPPHRSLVIRLFIPESFVNEKIKQNTKKKKLPRKQCSSKKKHVDSTTTLLLSGTIVERISA